MRAWKVGLLGVMLVGMGGCAKKEPPKPAPPKPAPHVAYTLSTGNGGSISQNPEDFRSAVDYCFHQQWSAEHTITAPNFYAGDTCDIIKATAANRYWLHSQTDLTFDAEPDFGRGPQ